jgi:hypothetical protein
LLPRAFHDVAVALARERTALEAGGVFPRHVIDRMVDALSRQ